jgi:hypothetical protein
MTSKTPGVAAIVCAACLSACAANDGSVYNDGIAESAPVGTNIKSRDGYRRGGSSLSVRVIGRDYLRDPAVSSAQQLPDRQDVSRQQ